MRENRAEAHGSYISHPQPYIVVSLARVVYRLKQAHKKEHLRQTRRKYMFMALQDSFDFAICVGRHATAGHANTAPGEACGSWRLAHLKPTKSLTPNPIHSAHLLVVRAEAEERYPLAHVLEGVQHSHSRGGLAKQAVPMLPKVVGWLLLMRILERSDPIPQSLRVSNQQGGAAPNTICEDQKSERRHTNLDANGNERCTRKRNELCASPAYVLS